MFIANEGWPFILIPLCAGVLFFVFGRSSAAFYAGGIFVALALFCAYFFRNPERSAPQDDRLVISPCDGTVMEVTEENGVKVIRTFLSVLNVHIQRSPCSGTVKSVQHCPGKFLPAMDARACTENEQIVTVIDSPKGEIVVKQIAGILARRCVSWMKPGDTVAMGQRIGLIKFGSQVDVDLPKNADIKVKAGDKVAAGITIYAEYR